jgi:phosphotransferase system enzyme I (PtsI)
MTSSSEIRISAQAVSRGIAIGAAVSLYGRRRQYFRTHVPPEQLAKEVRRFRAAKRLAARQLEKLRSGNGRLHVADNALGILEFQLLMLADPMLSGEIETTIHEDGVNAEWAVQLVTDKYLSEYKTIADERLRERHVDIEDVTERILTALGGGQRIHNGLESGSIVVAKELNPSTLIELADGKLAGIVTEHGGWTSHTFILARERGIPAVAGVRRALQRIHTGETVIVDGFHGDVLIRPTAESLEVYRRRSGVEPRTITQPSSTPLRTLDARPITIRANTDIPGGYEHARQAGALGVGLYRSEYIFNRFRGVPTENEQYQAYRKIAEMTGEHGVRIRTFDFGSDDIVEQSRTKCKNPALGLRAIRLSLDHEKQFRDQLRALLRAAYQTKIDIILPMISDLSEVRRVKELLRDESERLALSGITVGEPRLGVMVEVPSTVFMIDEILDEVDVICLGTNDLVQYLLAVDRDNEEVSKWFRTLNPAIIRAVRTVLKACADRKTPCVVCGEMAGSPYYVPALVGLGATELSMNPNSIRRVRDLVSGIAYEETLSLVRALEQGITADEIEAINRKFIADNWSHLYDQPPS